MKKITKDDDMIQFTYEQGMELLYENYHHHIELMDGRLIIDHEFYDVMITILLAPFGGMELFKRYPDKAQDYLSYNLIKEFYNRFTKTTNEVEQVEIWNHNRDCDVMAGYGRCIKTIKKQ